jgi:hypothetical protein
MDKKVFIDAFYEQFLSLMTELTEMYPDDPDFSFFSTALRMIRTTNPAMMVKYVRDNTSPFEEIIEKRDESFFLNYSFSEYDGHVKNPNIFNKLKEYIVSMSPDTKEFVWKYIHNITRLAKAIH